MTLYSQDERATIAAAQRIRRERRQEANRANNARKPAEKRHRGRVRDAAHLGFIRRLPCVATFVQTGQLVYGCQAAHVRMVREGKPGGMGVKPSDKWALPLTPEQHDRQTNQGGEVGYWNALGIDPITLCERLYAVSGDKEAAVKIIMESGK